MQKNLFLKIAIAAMALTCCALCVLRFVSLEKFTSLPISEKNKGATNIRGLRKDEALPEAELFRIGSDAFTDFEQRSKVALKFAEIAGGITDADKKIDYLCKTLESLALALRKQPLRARSLVTWSNVKQLLGSYACPNDHSDGFESALKLALNSDPLDQQALFNSGLVYLWAGKKEQAYPIFQRVLELATDTSVLQREFIYSLVDNAQSLNVLIPAKLSQVIEFLRYSLTQDHRSAANLVPKKDLWDFEIIALREFTQRFEFGEVEGELYLERLYDFWKLTKHSALTPLIDKLFADYYSKHEPEELASFFSSRSRFAELEVVSGLRIADSRPEKSSLAYWESPSEITFDEFFSSIGFYLPRENTLRRIELHSNSRTDFQLSGLIRVLQSEDNNSWEDVTGISTISQVELPGRTVLYVDLPGSTKRFWKIHFASPSRTHQFRGTLDNVIRAFGVGNVNG